MQVQAGLAKPWRHRGLRTPNPGSALQWPSRPSKEKMPASAASSTPAPVSTRSWELSLFARHLIKTISLKETKMESFTFQYSSAFWHSFPHQLGCKLVIRRAIQWLCSREALQHMCHLFPGRQVEGTGGTGTGNMSLGCWSLQFVVAAWDWAETQGLGMEQSQQEGLECLHELCGLLLGPWTSG